MKKVRKFTPDEDASLLLSWHRGDISAFETLVWKYLKRIFSLAFYLTGNAERAAVAAQGAFLAAYVNISSFSSRFHFSNWLIALTLKETRKQLDESGPELQKTVGTDAGLHDQLAAQILKLPAEMAEILVLRYVRGYPLERLAEVYGLRSDILVARLSAAHEMLAALISKGETLPGQFLPIGTDKFLPHPEIRLSFHAYLDSALSREDAEKIRKHLKSCGSCRAALTRLEWMNEHLNKLPDIDPPHWLAAAIMQNVKSTAANPVYVRKTPPALYLQFGVGLLFIAVIGMSAYLLFHDYDDRPAAVSGRETVRKPDNTSPQSSQQKRSAGAITAKAVPERNPDKPLASAGRMVAPSAVSSAVPTVPLPPVVSPDETSPDRAASTVITPAATPAISEAAVSGDRIKRSPELPPEWGESLPNPGPQEK